MVIEEPPCDPLSPTDRVVPVPTFIVMPEHPRSTAGRRGTEGEATVSILVDENGRVRETKIETGSGWNAFDQAVVRAAHRAEFRPATVNCEPVERWFEWKVAWERKTGKGATAA